MDTLGRLTYLLAAGPGLEKSTEPELNWVTPTPICPIIKFDENAFILMLGKCSVTAIPICPASFIIILLVCFIYQYSRFGALYVLFFDISM